MREHMHALHAGIGRERHARLIHHRHGRDAELDARLAGAGHHPGAAYGRVRLALKEERVDGGILRFARH